jgi:NADH dehydrogenase [ubiquinone] 1 alpha subcomplex assembly factor 1
MRGTKQILTAAALSALIVGSVRAMGDEIEGKLIYSFEDQDEFDEWEVVNDTVMGGVSNAMLGPGEEGTAVFSGTVSLENNGGFASTRSKPKDHGLADHAGLAIRVKGDGQKYKLGLRQDGRWDGVMYQASFATKKGEWVVVKVPFGRFLPTYHGRVLEDVPQAQADRLRSVGFLISDKQAGPFRLEIDWVKAYSGAQ